MKTIAKEEYIFEIGDFVLIPLSFVAHRHNGRVGELVGVDGDYAIINVWEPPYRYGSGKLIVWDINNLEPFDMNKI